MSKEGIGFLGGLILFSLVLTLGAWNTGKLSLIIISVLCWILVGFVLYFFRDPDRTIPPGENIIVSPGDGKVIAIEKAHEPNFFAEEVVKVSIFLSIFDVHITRIPIDGKVTYFDYIRGKYHRAYKKEASEENEQSIIGIENERQKILFKQIAGIIARRIVCHIRAGHTVKKGERFGMIKFGSRIDIFLPTTVQLNVRLNEHVRGGESIIGIYHEK